MEMRTARVWGMCGLLVAGLACSRVSPDNSKVVANVGGEKITEKAFTEAVKILLGDEARAKDLLTNPANRDQRNRFLQEFVDQKVLVKYGDKQGLGKDPKAKLLVDAAKANAYGQVLMERAVSTGEPSEEQMKAFYEKVKAQAKAAGQDKDFPAYEAVKAQLPAAVRRDQIKEASQGLIGRAKAAVPATIDPEWRSAEAK
ncbi:hypothetical protein [Mesoterricola sediminis]|uniref:Peptidylprolyl isomerase n=1 Tax=Mesoterricola sediminis TaxID=2927980 RepID=A0AA48KDH2_9BACT|nr:hypothetical protein [Mesoterricola sediminis]BDU78304.1 hypothetical protein METESE_32620 [Mesoterricola sediminis]